MLLEALCSQIADEGIEFVDLRVVDLAGRWRHVTIPAERFGEPLMAEGVAFDASNLGYAGVEGSDLVLIPDLQTGTIVEENGNRFMCFICNIHVPQTGEVFAGDPRAVALRAEQYLRVEGIAETVQMSPEFEFYVFREATFRSDQTKASYDLEPVNLNTERSYYHACPPEDQLFALRNQICRDLRKQGIKVKYHHHEVSPFGQLEIELGFLGLRDAGDATLLVKNRTRSIASEAGMVATFLPKPIYGENGSGLHVHQFLERDGKSLFEDAGDLSQLARYYIGGILSHGRSLCALTNPSTNSFRRLVPGYEAPVWFAYGLANRSAAIRIPSYASARERRMELRTPDATCNPYLAFAAMLMAGLDGIQNEVDAASKGYGPFDDNLYDCSPEVTAGLETAPVNLEDALSCLEADHEYLLAGGVFTETQIEDWIRTKRQEARNVRNRPHPYEFPLYFDL